MGNERMERREAREANKRKRRGKRKRKRKRRKRRLEAYFGEVCWAISSRIIDREHIGIMA